MTLYAVKINGKYFREYDYVTKEDQRRYAGNATLDGLLKEGDIKDIICTDKPVRLETRRSVGNTVSVLYTIDKFKRTCIEIIPIEE